MDPAACRAAVCGPPSVPSTAPRTSPSPCRPPLRPTSSVPGPATAPPSTRAVGRARVEWMGAPGRLAAWPPCSFAVCIALRECGQQHVPWAVGRDKTTLAPSSTRTWLEAGRAWGPRPPARPSFAAPPNPAPSPTRHVHSPPLPASQVWPKAVDCEAFSPAHASPGMRQRLAGGAPEGPGPLLLYVGRVRARVHAALVSSGAGRRSGACAACKLAPAAPPCPPPFQPPASRRSAGEPGEEPDAAAAAAGACAGGPSGCGGRRPCHGGELSGGAVGPECWLHGHLEVGRREGCRTPLAPGNSLQEVLQAHLEPPARQQEGRMGGSALACVPPMAVRADGSCFDVGTTLCIPAACTAGPLAAPPQLPACFLCFRRCGLAWPARAPPFWAAWRDASWRLPTPPPTSLSCPQRARR